MHIDAELLYAAALDRLARSPQVEIRLGEAVRSVEDDAHPRVHTSAGTIDAAPVFDALGPNSPLQPGRSLPAASFAQRFVGWEVEVGTPVFDPSVATLMDFRGHAGTGTTFMYVLPFSATRALIEHTSIEPFDAPPVDRDAALEHELEVRYGVHDWQVLRREHGLIPMMTHPFRTQHNHRVYRLGAAAGAIRPSSGYAFTRIGRQVDAVAAAIAAGTPLPTRVSSVRSELLDRVSLHALARSRHPEELFFAAASVDADAFARFMNDVSSPGDEARMIAALPMPEMARAALGAVASREGMRKLRGSMHR